MSLKAFLAENALQTEQVEYVASDRFVENGKPVPWVIRALGSAEDEALRKMCTKRTPVFGKKGQYQNELDVLEYMAKLGAACTVYPNLNDKELQDSYHVMGGEELLKKMLTAGEYNLYIAKVQQVCGFDRSFQEDVDEAKN